MNKIPHINDSFSYHWQQLFVSFLLTATYLLMEVRLLRNRSVCHLAIWQILFAKTVLTFCLLVNVVAVETRWFPYHITWEPADLCAKCVYGCGIDSYCLCMHACLCIDFSYCDVNVVSSSFERH